MLCAYELNLHSVFLFATVSAHRTNFPISPSIRQHMHVFQWLCLFLSKSSSVGQIDFRWLVTGNLRAENACMSVFVGWLVGLFDWLSARVCLSEHLSFFLCSTCLSLSDCLYGRIRDQGFKTGSVHLNVMLSCHVMSLCHLMSSSHRVFLLLFVSGVVFFFLFTNQLQDWSKYKVKIPQITHTTLQPKRLGQIGSFFASEP